MSKEICSRGLVLMFRGIVGYAVGAVVLKGVAEDAAAATGTAKPQAAAFVSRATNPLDGQRAYSYLQQMCAIGPRPSGSAAMEKQQTYLKQQFEKLGGKVTFQHFLAKNP